MSIASWNKKLAILSDKWKAKETIWFSRPPFYKPEFRDVVPKWHVFSDRTKDDEEGYTYEWSALCGYKHKFWELLEDLPKLKLGKATPKKIERCARCVRKLEAQKKAGALDAAQA